VGPEFWIYLGGALFAVCFGSTFNLWLQSRVCGAGIGFLRILRLQWARIGARRIVQCRIAIVQSGLDVPVDDIVASARNGADLVAATRLVIRGHTEGRALEWSRAVEHTRTTGA